MIVNSAKEYRQWIREQRRRPEVDIDFIGCSRMDENRMIKGFFELFHGFKDDIEKFLPSVLDIAEDNQAIFEFLQNAVDCGATHFWAFYNDQYFIAVNNGKKFTLNGISSILNNAQSDKTSSIGRLGIGFKLVHRLLGKGNGVYELIHNNKGPILFSWNKQEQLASLLSNETISYDGLDENPYLFKIAITNFPVNADENVKNINYEDTIVFPSSELVEMRTYASQCIADLYSANPLSFSQGSLFFIKLGEKKKQLLDADLATLRNGIEYSMNTLKQLSHICFNGETIMKKMLVINETTIDKTSEKFRDIDPQYKNYDILYSFGYLPLDFSSNDYYQVISQLKQSPNFYKYFPMGDEVDNMALFVHSDSFQIEANRRKLINDHTNRELLPVIAKYIIETLSSYKDTDRNKFLQLYAAILLTDKPSAQEKSWMNCPFFDLLLAAIKGYIPTTIGDSTNSAIVKIKKVKMDIPLGQIGLGNYQWFYWYGDNHKEIIFGAGKKEKLGLEEWNINDLITKANIVSLNTWLDSCSLDMFDQFISEIHSITTSKEAESRLPKIKLFKIGSERKTRDEIMANKDYVIITKKTLAIKTILEKIGMKCTDDAIENHLLSTMLKAQDEKKLFAIIKEKAENDQNWNVLLPGDKLSLITTLKDFENVGDSSIKQLRIFKNIEGEQCALENLIAFRENVEFWQRPYVICKEECFNEVQSLLVSNESVFSDIVGNHYDDIIAKGTSIDELYSIYQNHGTTWTDDLTLKIINTYGCTDEVLSLIEKHPSKSSVEEFVKKMGTLKISSTQDYPENSFEYRCIKVAAKEDVIAIRYKILIDGTKLTDFTSSNELKFRFKNKEGKEMIFSMELSDVLPENTQCALYGKVSEKFSRITDYKKIFSADSSDSSTVQRQLREILSKDNVIITPAQFIFILIINYQKGNSSISSWGNIVRFCKDNESAGPIVTGILDYAYKNIFDDVLIEYKSLYLWRPFIQNKYLFSTDYTLKEERAFKEIEIWCENDSDKKEFLKKLNMRFPDCIEIKRRKRFLEDKLESWDGETPPNSFIRWIGSSDIPIVGSKQKELLRQLVHKAKNADFRIVYKEEDCSDALELDTSKYKKWKSSNNMSIYKLSHEIPYRIIYKDKILVRYNYLPYKYYSTTKHLYIYGIDDPQVVGVLAQVYQDSAIPFYFKDYVSICFDSYEEQRAKDQELDRYRKLEEENERIKIKEERIKIEKERAQEEFRNKYSARVKEFLGGDFSMPSDKVKSEHIISRYRILMYIKSLNVFTLKQGFDEKHYIRTDGYAPIPLSNGKHINVQGAKDGIWHLSPVIWNDIVEKGNYECLCTGNGDNDFILINNEDDIKRVAERTKNVFMRLTPTSSMNIMDTIKSVISSNTFELDDDMILDTIYTNRDVHLMLMVHPTKEPVLNSIFDTVFKSEGDYNISELGE